jgi:RNase H-like domain found in reverse transcriptase/Integrase zinc binding domain
MLLLLALASLYTNYKMVTPVLLHIYHMHLVTCELNWGIPEKELYALINSLEKFKPYLYGPQLTWITDAKCLTWLYHVKDTSPKLLRWCLQIQSIDFSVQHKPGKNNVVADALSRIILDFASKDTRGYTLPNTLPSTILAPMLELIVEPYAPFATPDTLASVFVEPSLLVQGRTNAGSDECVLTDLVASVATVFPDRDGIATAQCTDAFFGPILSALEHTSSIRSSIGNDYAISGDLVYKLPSGSTSKYNQARLYVLNSMVDSLYKHYHNSSLGGNFNALRTYDRLRVLYTWPNMGQDIFKRCESCHSCNSTRPRHPDTHGIMSSTPPTRPFERLSVDLIKLPRS